MKQSLFTGLAALVLTVFTGTIASAADQDIAAMIENAAQGTTLKIKPGTYTTKKTIQIVNKKDLVIDAAGVKLVVTDHVNAINIADSQNITLKGMSFDYNPLPYTQATITSIDYATAKIEADIHKGYPDINEFKNQGTVMVFDGKTRLWKRDVYGFYNADIKKNGDRKISVDLKHKDLKIDPIKPGDMIVIEQRKIAGLNLVTSKNVTLENLTIYSAPGIAIIGRYMSGDQIVNGIKITRGSKPEGATEERLYSTGADGINYAYCRQGPIITNCDIGFMGDDGVNLHGTTMPIYKIESDSSVILMRPQGGSPVVQLVENGDRVLVLKPDSFATAAEGILESLERTESKAPTEAESQDIVKYYPSTAGRTYDKISFYRLKFKGPVKAEVGQYITVPAINCPGFVIRNNYFHDHRARGLRIMAQDGVITENRFERTGQSAISVGAEFNYWREAGWVKNVVISKNDIKDAGVHLDATSPWAYSCGAISIFTFRGKDNPPIYPGHENIIIDSNKISTCGSVALHAYGVKGLILTNNQVENAMTRDVSATGSEKGFSLTKPFMIHDSYDIIDKNNTVK